MIYAHLNGGSLLGHDDDSRIFDDLDFKHWYPEQKLQTNKEYYTLYTNGNDDDNDDATTTTTITTVSKSADIYIEDPYM